MACRHQPKESLHEVLWKSYDRSSIFECEYCGRKIVYKGKGREEWWMFILVIMFAILGLTIEVLNVMYVDDYFIRNMIHPAIIICLYVLMFPARAVDRKYFSEYAEYKEIKRIDLRQKREKLENTKSIDRK